MSNELQGAMRSLEMERDRKLAEVAQIERVLAGMKGLVVIVGDQQPLPTSLEYAGMGILEAAKAFAKAAGRPLTTRELADGMTEKGWTTKSRNISATIYATLRNKWKSNDKDWNRTPAGEWEYVGP